MPAQIVQRAVGEAGQPFVAGRRQRPGNALAQLAGGRSRERPVQRIHLGQEANILRRAVPRKGLGRGAAAVFDDIRAAELGEGAGHLGSGQPCHLGQVAAQQGII